MASTAMRPNPRNESVAACLAALQRIAATALAADNVTLDSSGVPTQPLSKQALTPFHSSCVPPMTVLQYASRIATYSGYGIDGLIFGLVLLARYSRCTGRLPNMLTVHRLLLVCTAVAMKANSDFFYKNVYVAQAGGIPISELNRLESELLVRVHFSVMITGAEVEALLSELPRERTSESSELNRVFLSISAAIRPFGPALQEAQDAQEAVKN
jgi:hypothetical protein